MPAFLDMPRFLHLPGRFSPACGAYACYYAPVRNGACRADSRDWSRGMLPCCHSVSLCRLPLPCLPVYSMRASPPPAPSMPVLRTCCGGTHYGCHLRLRRRLYLPSLLPSLRRTWMGRSGFTPADENLRAPLPAFRIPHLPRLLLLTRGGYLPACSPARRIPPVARL